MRKRLVTTILLLASGTIGAQTITEGYMRSGYLSKNTFGPGSAGFLPTCSAVFAGPVTVNCPNGVAFRDFTTLSAVGSNPVVPQNTGSYNAGGVSVPRISDAAKIGPTFYALNACSPVGYTWLNLCLYTGSSPISWTDAAGNPKISAVAATWEDHWLLHGAMSPACSIDTYCAYYSAISLTGENAIGIASSPDLITWTKYPSNPVIPHTGGGGVTDPSLPSVIQIGSNLVMYTAIGCVDLGICTNQIVYWTSPASDGIHWTYGGVALPAPIIGDWDFGIPNIIDPMVFKNKHGFYEMVYTADGTFSMVSQQKLGYAVSADGITWFKYAAAPILTQSTYGYPGTVPYLGDGHFFEDGSSFYLLFDISNGTTAASGWTSLMKDY